MSEQIDLAPEQYKQAQKLAEKLGCSIKVAIECLLIEYATGMLPARKENKR